MATQNHDHASTADAPTGRRRGKRRLTPPVWVWVVLVAAGLAIAILQGTDLAADHVVANVLTLIAAFVALMALLVWFSFFSGYSRRVRMIPGLGGLAIVGVLAALFRVERVSGELVPTFALRFSRKADELLRKPEPVDEKLIVDVLTATPHDFPQFLGPQRNLSIDGVTLARDWDRHPPQLVWRQAIGAGWSGFSVVGGYAVTMEQRNEEEMVTCYEVDTGRLRWVHAIRVRYDTVLAGAGPRATPTIDEGMVYTLGATGRLFCLDGATGSLVWEKDLRKETGVTEEDELRHVPYGRANSPLVVGDLLIVPAGGPKSQECVSLVAYHKKTGARVWRGGQRQISYSSPVLATLAGVEQILIVNEDYVSGHDVQTGDVLWEHPWPGSSRTTANVSQAVPVSIGNTPPDRVFLSKGYGGGGALIRVLPDGDGTLTTEELWHNSRVMRTKFTNVAVRDGYVYGLSDGILECVELKTGQRKWKGGRYGHGQILRVGQLLLVLAESGELLLVEASPDRNHSVLGRRQALEGMTWNNLALYGRYLLVRNAREAACYELALERP